MIDKSPNNPKPSHQFLIQIGLLLHQYGTPSHRLERLVGEMAKHFGLDGSCLYTPTSLLISIKADGEDAESTYLRRVDSGPVDVAKLIRFDETLEEVEAGKCSIEEASKKLDEIANSPPPFSDWITCVASGVSCGAVAVFFRGSVFEILASFTIGLIIAFVELLPKKLNWENGLLEPMAGFLAALLSLAIANYIVPIDDRLVTLAALIILVPGLRLTVALNELAVGHSTAGVARLASACVSLLTLTIGVAICWRIFSEWRQLPEPPDAATLVATEWCQWAAILIAPITFAIVFRARSPQWPVILMVSIAGFTSSVFAGKYFGIEVGAAAGALAVGIGSNLYARFRNRPALITLTPGILVLVPGSLGYRSLTAFLDSDTLAGIDFAFKMMIVAVALVGGILTANLLVPPRRIL